MGDAQLRHALSGRTVLVTGVAGATAEAPAWQLAHAGAKVLVTAHPTEQVVVPACEPHEPVVRCFVDPAVPGAMRELAERVLDEHGGVDVLVHRASGPVRRAAPRSRHRAREAHDLFTAHFAGPTTLIRALLPSMRTRGSAHLIAVFDAGARLPVPPWWGDHRAARAAFDAWFRGLAREARTTGVAITGIYTGFVRSASNEPASPLRRALGLTRSDTTGLILDAIARRPRQLAPWWIRPAPAAGARRVRDAPRRRPDGVVTTGS